jgi:hypothetical protein
LKTSILLFLLSPFTGVVQAFKHYKESWAKNSIWLFVAFYGYTMYKPEEMDVNRYVLKLQELHSAPLNWDAFVANFYNEEGDTIDVYQPLVTYIIAMVTDSGNILFAVFGFIYGYFYSRNIWLLFGMIKEKRINRVMWIVLASFALTIGFWEINGVRMWTAAHIFFYGTFLLLVKDNKKGFLIAASSMLVHFSFMLPFAVLVFFRFVKLPWKILYLIFLASFFVSQFNVSSFGETLSTYLPEFLLPKVKGYTSDEYIETVSEAPVFNWYMTFYIKCLTWFIVMMLSSIYFSGLTLMKNNKAFSNLFGFTLLFLTVGNIMSLVPSGSRYLIIARLFAMALLFLFYFWYDIRSYKKHIVILSPLLVFFLIVSVRVSFETTTFVTILANPIIAMFIDFPVPLITLLK